jgi:hypothetical protein
MSNTIEDLKKFARSSEIVPKQKKISDETLQFIISSIHKNMTEAEVYNACSSIDVWELTDEQNQRLIDAMPIACQKKILLYRKKFLDFMEQFGKDPVTEEKRDRLFEMISLVRAGFPFSDFEHKDIEFLLKLLGPTYIEIFGKLLQTEDLFNLSLEEIEELIEC